MVWTPLRIVGPDDDVLHDPEDDPAWSEHHYFFFADSAGRLAGGCRIAWRTGDGAAKGFMFCFTAHGVCLWQQDGGDRLRSGALSFEGSRLGAWSIRFDAPALLLPDPLALAGLSEVTGETRPLPLAWDLRFDPVSPAVGADLDSDAAPLVRRIAPHRFEQVGRTTGTARVGEETIVIDGFGVRDHSWGVRRAERLQEWRWCAVPIGAELCGGAGHVRLADGEITSGWLSSAGEPLPVTDARIDYRFDSTGMVPRSAAIAYTLGGERRVVSAEVLTPLGLRVVEHGREVLAVESLARYSSDDGRTGLGVVEYVKALS